MHYFVQSDPRYRQWDPSGTVAVRHVSVMFRYFQFSLPRTEQKSRNNAEMNLA